VLAAGLRITADLGMKRRIQSLIYNIAPKKKKKGVGVGQPTTKINQESKTPKGKQTLRQNTRINEGRGTTRQLVFLTSGKRNLCKLGEGRRLGGFRNDCERGRSHRKKFNPEGKKLPELILLRLQPKKKKKTVKLAARSQKKR